MWLYLFLYLNSGLGRRYLTAITCFNALGSLISKVRSNSIICLPYSILLNELFGPHTQSHRKTPNEEEEDEGKKQPLFANIKAYKVRSNEKLFFSHMSPVCHRVFPIPLPLFLSLSLLLPFPPMAQTNVDRWAAPRTEQRQWLRLLLQMGADFFCRSREYPRD